MVRTAPPATRRSRVLGALFALATAGCTTTPEPAEVLACGFRSPEQTFRTFQVAVRADEPALEYRCFSTGFRAEHQLSQWAWRELREGLWGQLGTRWAVARAQPTAAARVQGGRATLTVEALGKVIELGFVREDFGELWSGETRLSDDEADFRAQSGTQEGRWFYGQVEMPPGSESAKVTEMRLGQEWKLDRIDFDGGS